MSTASRIQRRDAKRSRRASRSSAPSARSSSALRATRGARSTRVPFGLLILLVGSACDSPAAPGASPSPRSTQPPVDWFEERAAEVGLDFSHFNGMSGEYYFCEPVGPGAALFDLEGDGDLDVYLVQGAMLGDRPVSEARSPPPAGLELRDRLFRNLRAETGNVRFEDITADSGIDSRGYGMGVAVGDANGDGRPDLYVTNFGANAFFLSQQDGTYREAALEAGVADDRWNTSAAFLDYDADGDLDLFVCAYVRFTLRNNKECYSETSARDYCGPLSFPPEPDRLYRNRGDGTFEDVTAVAGLARAYGAGLGVTVSDFDGDGRLDIFVANDGMPNQCWIQRPGNTFEDTALLAGCAYNADGVAEASMGVDAADYDGDGDDDLFMTHLTSETNTLYRNDGHGVFEDVTLTAGLGLASRAATGFGTAWCDLDNDGWLDLLIANGAVKTIESLARKGDIYPLHQPNQLFRNLGGGRFEEVTAQAGRAFELSEVSRGAAFGDVDDDGDVDVLIANNSGPVRLLVNRRGQAAPWIGVDVREADGRRPAIDARVEARWPGARTVRRVRVAASYCSSNDPRIVLGTGDRGLPEEVRIRWPDGTAESFRVTSERAYSTLVRGRGESVRSGADR